MCIRDRGKEVAEELRKKQQETPPSSQNHDVIDQLRQLAKLKEDGIITEDEFNDMKKKILQ